MTIEQKRALAVGGAIIAGAAALWYFLKKQAVTALEYEPTSPTLIDTGAGGGGIQLPDINIPEFKFPNITIPGSSGGSQGGAMYYTPPGNTQPQTPTQLPIAGVPQLSTYVGESQKQYELSPFGQIWGKLGLAAAVAGAGTYAAGKIGLTEALRNGWNWFTGLFSRPEAIGNFSMRTGTFPSAGILPLKLTDPEDTLGSAFGQGISGNPNVWDIAHEHATQWSEQYGPLAPVSYAVTYPLYAAYAGVGQLWNYLTNAPPVTPAQQQITNVPPAVETPSGEPQE